MAVLLGNRPEYKLYNEIPYLELSSEEFSRTNAKFLLNKLGNLFVKHKLWSQFGLALVHRHFDLFGDEFLVETFNSDNSISSAMPWNLQGDKAEPIPSPLWTSLKLEKKRFVVAQSWSFSDDGDLRPFEYLSTDELMTDPPKEFLDELLQHLKAVGLDKIIGLRRIEGRKGRFSWESTPEGQRANVTSFGSKPDYLELKNMIPVVWYFSQDGNLIQSDWCVLHSGSVCDNHSK